MDEKSMPSKHEILGYFVLLPVLLTLRSVKPISVLLLELTFVF